MTVSKPAKCLSPRRETNKIIYYLFLFLFFYPFDFLFGHIINILLTELGRSVWENLDLGSLVQTSLRSVCTGDLGQDSPIQTSRSVNKN